MKKPRHKSFLEKSVSSAVSAIEIYNKPNFVYREETFSILIINAWELLLKAKIIKHNNNKISSIYQKEQRENKDGTRSKKKYNKLNRCGNPMTIGLIDSFKIISKYDTVDFDKSCIQNLLLLLEIRDNSIHFRHDDKALAIKIQEVGTANLKNYLNLVKEWFDFDLSQYNFYLMPLSFYHEFETVTSFSVSQRVKEVKSLLEFIKQKEQQYLPTPENPYNITLKIETKFTRSTDTDALLVRRVSPTDDPNAIAITLKDEDIRIQYPWDYKKLTITLKKRYKNFKINAKFHKILKPLKSEIKYCKERSLDPGNPNALVKRFYSPEVLKKFDENYKKSR